MRLLLLLPLLGACGDVSNALFEEDAEFLDALPSEERHTVAFDGAEATSRGLGDTAELYALSTDIARSANWPVLQVLVAVDYIRDLPPTSRTEDQRTWGPHPWQDDVEIVARVTREGTGEFRWELGGIPGGGDEVTWVSGTHYAGDSVANGDGAFTWDLGAEAALLGDPSTGVLVVDYDNREGIDLLLDLSDYSDGTTAPVDADYAFRKVEDVGDFQYRTWADLGGDSALEELEVRSRWTEGDGGRSDAAAAFDRADWTASQCWTPAGALLYQVDDAGYWEALGEATDCAFTDFAEVDRI